MIVGLQSETKICRLLFISVLLGKRHNGIRMHSGGGGRGGEGGGEGAGGKGGEGGVGRGAWPGRLSD